MGLEHLPIHSPHKFQPFMQVQVNIPYMERFGNLYSPKHVKHVHDLILNTLMQIKPTVFSPF